MPVSSCLNVQIGRSNVKISGLVFRVAVRLFISPDYYVDVKVTEGMGSTACHHSPIQQSRRSVHGLTKPAEQAMVIENGCVNRGANFSYLDT